VATRRLAGSRPVVRAVRGPLAGWLAACRSAGATGEGDVAGRAVPFRRA